jgi:hypothetical protein
MIALIMLLLVESMITQPTNIQFCTTAGEKQCTQWGHMRGFSDRRSIPIKDIKGRVFAPVDRPLDGVLVEIYEFTSTDSMPLESYQILDCSKRKAACITNEKGRFFFKLPSGIYEVRASKDGWCTPSVLITIDSKKGKRIDTDINIRVGV